MTLPRFSLTTRIFLSSAGIVILVLAAALFFTQRSALNAAETSITRQLDATVRLVDQTVKSERAELKNRALIYVQTPTYRARVEAPKDSSEYLDFAQTAEQQVGAQWAQLISREGIRLAKSDAPSAAAEDLSGSPLIRAALEKQNAEGFGVAGDSTLIETV